MSKFFDTLDEAIQGEIYDPIVKDLNGTPNRVLELDKNWTAEIKWKLESNAPVSHPVDLIDGTWNVRISLESISPELEVEVSSVDVPFSAFDTSSEAERSWKKEVTIPANLIPTEGVYQLVTLITYHYPSGTHQPGPTPDDDMPGEGKRIGPRGAMAGFSEGPLITFYSD